MTSTVEGEIAAALDGLRAAAEHLQAALTLEAPPPRAEPVSSAAPTPERRLLSVRQVAERLQVSRPLVYKLMDKGELPYLQLETCRRIDSVALDTYLAACRVEITGV